MHVTDLTGTQQPLCADELIAMLYRRNEEGLNAFWLTREIGAYPILMILVNNGFAHLMCTRWDGDAGLISSRTVEDTDSMESIRFTLGGSEADDIYAPLDLVVPIEDAMKAVGEFFLNPDTPPHGLHWMEL